MRLLICTYVGECLLEGGEFRINKNTLIKITAAFIFIFFSKTVFFFVCYFCNMFNPRISKIV